MAVSKSKVILFATTRHDRKVHQHPVAVFNSAPDAKTYATFLKLAYRSADLEAVKSLDPEVTLDGEGALIAETKWSMVEVRYAPQALPDDDEEEATAPSES